MQVIIESEVIDAIQAKAPERPTPKEFETAYEEVLTNPVLAEILWEMEESLELKKKKLAYAKIVLPAEIYDEIGEEFIMDEYMTFDKICTIGIGDPEADKLLDGGLSMDLVKAMTWKYLAHPWMIVDKITLLQFGATAETIEAQWKDWKIWAQVVAEMSEDDLNIVIFC